MHQEERHLPNTCFHDLNSDSENTTLRVVTLDPSHIWYAPVLTERPQTTDLTWKPATSLRVEGPDSGLWFSFSSFNFLFFFLFWRFIFVFSVYECLPAYMHVCLVPVEVRRGSAPPELSHKELWVTMWVPGLQPGLSPRAMSTLSLSLQPSWLFTVEAGERRVRRGPVQGLWTLSSSTCSVVVLGPDCTWEFTVADVLLRRVGGTVPELSSNIRI